MSTHVMVSGGLSSAHLISSGRSFGPRSSPPVMSSRVRSSFASSPAKSQCSMTIFYGCRARICIPPLALPMGSSGSGMWCTSSCMRGASNCHPVRVKHVLTEGISWWACEIPMAYRGCCRYTTLPVIVHGRAVARVHARNVTPCTRAISRRLSRAKSHARGFIPVHGDGIHHVKPHKGRICPNRGPLKSPSYRTCPTWRSYRPLRAKIAQTATGRGLRAPCAGRAQRAHTATERWTHRGMPALRIIARYHRTGGRPQTSALSSTGKCTGRLLRKSRPVRS